MFGDFDAEQTLVPRLEKTAARFPERLALQDETRKLTFAELRDAVDSLADDLRVRIARGDHVAVRLQRGVDYVVAAYAIWKAGGVYVPIDDNWPEARIVGILERSHVRMLIHAPVGAAGVKLTSLAQTGGAAMPCAGTPAYIIHTSGTTGVPKGVVVSHESLLHLVACHQRCIYQPHGVTSGAVALNATFCFDSAIERMALVAWGYTVHVIADPVRKSPHAFANYLREHRIANVDLVPSHLRVLLQNGLTDTAADLKLVIVGGEAIDVDLWLQLTANRVVFFNVYGPTENTINTTYCRVEGTTPHIGRPFDGVACHVIGSDGRRCAPGETGELWVAGSHLALGYYNAPELTAKAFVTFDGARCYRTGDMVKYDQSGDLQFLGRLDDQVKINGYRIELADVRRHLAQLPAVREAAVTPIERTGGHRLLASVVWEPDAADTTFADLSAQLAARLPTYMVPNHWQVVEALPLTDNLKLDHQALIQRWEQGQPRRGSANADADGLTVTESRVREIWQRILTRGAIAPDDHFFACGGDSTRRWN